MTDTFKLDSKKRPVIIKDPQAVLDYSWDWTDWLAGDKIISKLINVAGGITNPSSPRDGSCGTGIGYTTNAAGYAIGATSITLISGTGTILDTDFVTFDGDLDDNGEPRLYAVATGIASPGALILAAPGLQKAIPAAATNVSVRAIVTAMLGAGTLGLKKTEVFATCRITTFQGRTEDRTIYFQMQER